MAKKYLYITSPPRTGNNFLVLMINNYIEKNNIDSIYCNMSNHDSTFFFINDPNKYNFLIMRSPKDTFLSELVFNYSESYFNYIEDRFDSFKKTYIDHLKSFEESNSHHNFWIKFETLTERPENILIKVIQTIGQPYITIGRPSFDKNFTSPIDFTNDHPLNSDIFKNPIPNKNIVEKQRIKDFYKIATSHLDFSDINEEYEQFMIKFAKKELL